MIYTAAIRMVSLLRLFAPTAALFFVLVPAVTGIAVDEVHGHLEELRAELRRGFAPGLLEYENTGRNRIVLETRIVYDCNALLLRADIDKLLHDPLTNTVRKYTERVIARPDRIARHFRERVQKDDGSVTAEPRWEIIDAETQPGGTLSERRQVFERFVRSHVEGISFGHLDPSAGWLDGAPSDVLSGDWEPWKVREEGDRIVVATQKKTSSHHDLSEILGDTRDRRELVFTPGSPWLLTETRTAHDYMTHLERKAYERTQSGYLYVVGSELAIEAESPHMMLNIGIGQPPRIKRFVPNIEVSPEVFDIADLPEDLVFMPIPRPIGMSQTSFLWLSTAIHVLVLGGVGWLVVSFRRRRRAPRPM